MLLTKVFLFFTSSRTVVCNKVQNVERGSELIAELLCEEYKFWDKVNYAQ